MKNKVTEIDGKFYKEYNVVRLATDTDSNIVLNTKRGVLYTESLEGIKFSKNLDPSKWSNQHLYITSDDEIKDKDYIYHKLDKKVIQFDKKRHDTTRKDIREYGYKKVIATTDTSLVIYESMVEDKYQEPLPRPSNEFIQAYVKANGKGFDKVLVEIETIQTTKKEEYKYENGKGNLNYTTRIKIAPDNTITIKPVVTDWFTIISEYSQSGDISRIGLSIYLDNNYNVPTRKANKNV